MPIFYDVFNGDADGICALQQLRLADPRDSVLVTGVKRDIALLQRIEPKKGDVLTVLDIGLAANVTALQRHLANGAHCVYFDHHFPGTIPKHRHLKAVIDTAPEVCTSLLVNRFLDGEHSAWAVVAAFGDNLDASARVAALPLAISEYELSQLKELGEGLNYNAYGDSVEDLNYHPADLYETISRYHNPLDFIACEPVFEVLRQSRADDLFHAGEVAPELATPQYAIYVLPDIMWSRRVSGSFGNRLAQMHPDRAHAVLTRSKGGYLVSVRAPLNAPRGADALCRQFEGGGGRQKAAGINFLPDADFERFARAFVSTYEAK